MKGLTELMTCIQEISGGNYSGDIMHLTTGEYDPCVRDLAESAGLMVVHVLDDVEENFATCTICKWGIPEQGSKNN